MMSSDQQVNELLEDRLGRSDEIVDVDEPQVKLVIFTLADQYWALSGQQVHEILPGKEPLFFVPGMPDSVQGVINLRGEITSVIFLNGLLGLPYAQEKGTGPLLLASTEAMQSAVRIETLVDVADWPESELKPPPESLPEQLQPYVTAVFQWQNKAVTLLDLHSLFSEYCRGLG